MLDFPLLNESVFVKTREQFHTIAKIIGKCREMLVNPIAMNDNLWLSVVDDGFCTPPITGFNKLEIGCNPEKLIIELTNSRNKYDSLVIEGKTPGEISKELLELLKDFEINTEIDLSGFESGEVFDVTEKGAKDFLTQFINYNVLLREFHKSISAGVKTQVCLWPHHFDNAFKWFSGRKINDEEEQMGIGVSNGDDVYALPYVYVTFTPPLRKTNTLEITEEAILYDQEWTGLVLPYDEINDKKTIEAQSRTINDFLRTSFASVQRAFTKR